jgi:hypothetical protein
MRVTSGALERDRGLQHRFTDTVDEVTDMLYYLMDIYSLNQPQLSNALTSSLMEQWVLLHLCKQLATREHAATALYLLGQLLFVVKNPALQAAVARAMLVQNPECKRLVLQMLRPEDTADARVLLPALFVLYCVVRMPCGSVVLQEAELLPYRPQRQSALLAAVLGEEQQQPASPGRTSPVTPASSPPPLLPAALPPVPVAAIAEAGPEQQAGVSDALLRPLLESMGNASVSVTALQMQCLLLRALNISTILHTPAHEYHQLCVELLHEVYCASLRVLSAEQVKTFEAHVASYRQLVWTRLASQPEVLLGLSGRDTLTMSDEARDEMNVHRMLALRELYWTLMGVKDEALPLRPALMPLVQPGSTLCVTVSEGTSSYTPVPLQNGGHVLVYSGHVVVLAMPSEPPLGSGVPLSASGDDMMMSGIATIRGVVVVCVPLQYALVHRNGACALSLEWEESAVAQQPLVFDSLELCDRCELLLRDGRARVWHSKEEQLRALLTPPPLPPNMKKDNENGA